MIDFDAMTRKQVEINRKLRAAQTMKEKATDTSVHLTGMPHGQSDGKQLERALIEMIAAQESAKEAELELEEMRKQLRKEMRRLKKWQHIAVIRKRYLEGKPIRDVAAEIGYESAQTWRYMSEAKALINKG